MSSWSLRGASTLAMWDEGVACKGQSEGDTSLQRAKGEGREEAVCMKQEGERPMLPGV